MILIFFFFMVAVEIIKRNIKYTIFCAQHIFLYSKTALTNCEITAYLKLSLT